MRRHGTVHLLAFTLAILFLAGCGGCARFGGAASVPSDQKTALVLNQETARVLMNSTDKDSQILASALESSPESGSVLSVDHKGYLFGPDGKIQTDPKTGNALQVSTKMVMKLNSLAGFKELAGVAEVDYEVGGRSYLADLPAELKHMDTCPVPLRLRIKGLNNAALSSNVAANRTAAAAERDAIIRAMAELSKAKGAAFAVKVDAIANGVRVITLAGAEVVGTVLKTALLPTSSADVAAGVANAITAVIRTPDDKLVDVTAEGANATVLQDASSQ
jgi:hypothetical protein